jgi:hypothetical protein
VFNYYVRLAFRSWDRKLFVTALMITSIGVGIGVSMTTLKIFLAMARDPIPQQSAHLFVPQIENRGPRHTGKDSDLQPQISYADATNWMNSRAAERQTAMYATSFALTPSDPKLQPFVVDARAAYTDFLPMFGVPFLYGSTWSKTDDASSASVVVITRELNAGADKLDRMRMMSTESQRSIDVFLLRRSRHSKPLNSKTHHILDDPAHRAWGCGDGEYVFAAARGLVECLCRQGSSAIYSADRQSRS